MTMGISYIKYIYKINQLFPELKQFSKLSQKTQIKF